MISSFVSDSVSLSEEENSPSTLIFSESLSDPNPFYILIHFFSAFESSKKTKKSIEYQH